MIFALLIVAIVLGLMLHKAQQQTTDHLSFTSAFLRQLLGFVLVAGLFGAVLAGLRYLGKHEDWQDILALSLGAFAAWWWLDGWVQRRFDPSNKTQDAPQKPRPQQHVPRRAPPPRAGRLPPPVPKHPPEHNPAAPTENAQALSASGSFGLLRHGSVVVVLFICLLLTLAGTVAVFHREAQLAFLGQEARGVVLEVAQETKYLRPRCSSRNIFFGRTPLPCNRAMVRVGGEAHAVYVFGNTRAGDEITFTHVPGKPQTTRLGPHDGQPLAYFWRHLQWVHAVALIVFAALVAALQHRLQKLRADWP